MHDNSNLYLNIKMHLKFFSPDLFVGEVCELSISRRGLLKRKYAGYNIVTETIKYIVKISIQNNNYTYYMLKVKIVRYYAITNFKIMASRVFF